MLGIEKLVHNFRNAIEEARDNNAFADDYCFYKFPKGCCGDASLLLAHYSFNKNIKSYYAWGNFSDGTFEGQPSHAWLLLENKDTIIDITGDQFFKDSIFLNYDKAVYIGFEDEFHQLFDVPERHITENQGIGMLGRQCQPRLKKIYNQIQKYLQE